MEKKRQFNTENFDTSFTVNEYQTKTFQAHYLNYKDSQITITTTAKNIETTSVTGINFCGVILNVDGSKKLISGTANTSSNNSDYCNAPTKDGTPCQRKVIGGGYCWQHD